MTLWAVVMVTAMVVTPAAGQGYPVGSAETSTSYPATTQGSGTECGGDYYSDRGATREFHSPGYPDNYPNNLQCGYHLSTEQGGTITLRFDEFDLEPHMGCAWDFVKVYDGSSSTGNLLIEDKLCGSEIPPPISSTLDSMYVLFVTDHSVEHKGFSAVWSTKAPFRTTALPPAIRLDGKTHYSGTVLVTSWGKTGYICDRNFTKQDADVVCRMLGYRRSYKRYSSNSVTDPRIPFLVGNLNCSDHELDIFQCPWSSDTSDCSLDDVARVDCLELPTVSLVGGAASNSGTVVMTTNGHVGDVGPICSPWWGLTEGNVVCRMLGYSGASRVSIYNHYNYNSSIPFVLEGIKCRGNESHILDCPVENLPYGGDKPCTVDVTAGVECYDADDTPIDAAGCGLLPLVGGNEESNTDFWPQMCNIIYADQFNREYYNVCVGTLVKNSQGHFFLVTLASCVVGNTDPDHLRATCGDADLQVLQIKHITTHPEYSYATEDNNIAVLSLLFQPVENDYVQAACIPNEDHVAGEVGILVGWITDYVYGTTETFVQSNLTILSDEHCTTNEFNKYSNVCTTGTLEDDLCGSAGSQGGPMFTNRSGKWTLTGFTGVGTSRNSRWSYERNCYIYKQVITDVYDMRGWLDQQINGCY